MHSTLLHGVGRLVVQLLEALCNDPPNVLRSGVQSVLEGAHTGIRLGFAASPHWEDVYRLLHSWAVGTGCFLP